MAYGLRVSDQDGYSIEVTSEMISIVAAGRISTPSGLDSGNIYGNDIDLPGTNSYSEDEIAVIAGSFITNFDIHLYYLSGDDYNIASFYMNNTDTYYTRNESTGVLTQFTPGNRSSSTAYDSILALYPFAFWDKMGDTTFTSVRIFSAATHYIYDYSTSSYKYVYSLGTDGVENVDYSIYLRHYNE